MPKTFVEVRIEFNREKLKEKAVESLAQELYKSMLLDALTSEKMCISCDKDEIHVKVKVKGYLTNKRYGFSLLEIKIYVPYQWWNGDSTYSRNLKNYLMRKMESYAKESHLNILEDCAIFIKQIP